MSVIVNAVFVGALISCLAGLSPRAATTAFVIISLKTQFSDHVKTYLAINQWNV